MDLAGDGRQVLTRLDGSAPGYHRRTDDRGWSDLRPFAELPVLDWGDPNLRFVDLTGDGLADILPRTSSDGFTWHPSAGLDGFTESSWTATEERGPRLVFADPGQSIYLADLTGDGLTDLVRIRNGEVCYWPNLGYGLFGAKITKTGAPVFDHPDRFDQRRVHLSDVDGSSRPTCSTSDRTRPATRAPPRATQSRCRIWPLWTGMRTTALCTPDSAVAVTPTTSTTQAARAFAQQQSTVVRPRLGSTSA